MKKSLRIVLIILGLFLPYHAQGEDFTYSISNHVVTITGYTGAGGDLIIPAQIEDLPVVTIEEGAFWSELELTQITLPEGLIKIGNHAFLGCESLTNIIIPKSTIDMGINLFPLCSNLETITIDPDNPAFSSPQGVFFNKTQTELIHYPHGRPEPHYTLQNQVTNIASYVFQSCPNLTAILVDPSNLHYSSLDGVLFNKDQTLLIQYPSGKLETQYAIPDPVTTIGVAAFDSCYRLTLITLPDQLTTISDHSFFACDALTTLSIPDQVSIIEHDSFSACIELVSIYFEGNAPVTGSDIFYVNDQATVYRHPEATGWGSTYGGRPVVIWNPQISTASIQAEGFGFTIQSPHDFDLVVESCTNLTNHSWEPLGNKTLSGGTVAFSDTQHPNDSQRFYRLQMP